MKKNKKTTTENNFKPFSDFCQHFIKIKNIQAQVKKAPSETQVYYPNPTELAEHFCDFHNLTHPLNIEKLRELFSNPKLTIEPKALGGLRGFNITGGKKARVLYEEKEAPVAQVFTTLHEFYELIDRTIHELLGIKESDNRLEKSADKFAAHVQLPPKLVMEFLNEYGPDPIRLRTKFQCSYPTALIQIKEILHSHILDGFQECIPLIGIIYERRSWESKSSDKEPKLNYGYLVNGFPELNFDYKERHKNTKETFVKKGRKKHSLHSLSMKQKNMFLPKTTLHYKGKKIPVDLLIEIVPNHITKKASKVLTLITPSQHKVLHKVAKRISKEA